MFDFFSIFFWLIQLFFIGFAFKKFLPNSSLLPYFYPIIGLSITIIFTGILWYQDVTIYFIRYLFVLISTYGLYSFAKASYTNGIKFDYYFLVSLIIVVSVGSFLSFSEKQYNAYPLDRFVYVAASYLFANNNFDFFTSSFNKLGLSGDSTFIFKNPTILTIGPLLRAREIAELVLSVLSWSSPNSIYKLGNAYEVFLRALQFIPIFLIISKFTKTKYLFASIASLSIIFGYWLQYVKDFNAWPHSLSMVFFISIILLIIFYSDRLKDSLNYRFILYLFIISICATHIEMSIVLIASVLPIFLLRKSLRNFFIFNKNIYIEYISTLLLLYATFPYLIKQSIRMFNQSSVMTGGVETIAKALIRPFSENNYEFTHVIMNEPLDFIIDKTGLIDVINGILGYGYLGFFGSLNFIIFLSLILFIITVFYIFKKYKFIIKKELLFISFLITLLYLAIYVICYFSKLQIPFNTDTIASILLFIINIFIFYRVYGESITNYKKVIIDFSIIFITFFIIFLYFVLTKSYGGAFRMIGFWGAFSTIFLTLFLVNSRNNFIKIYSIIFILNNLIFGFSIFYYSYSTSLIKYFKFYPNKDGFRHFEMVDMRENFNIDYLNLTKELKKCKLVYIDIDENVGKYVPSNSRTVNLFVNNILLFLDNNNINYYWKGPYLNALIVGDIFHNGFKETEFTFDCNLGYKFINNKIHYSLSRDDKLR